jgi:5-methylcytosine-specific restriction endonuclease McrA
MSPMLPRRCLICHRVAVAGGSRCSIHNTSGWPAYKARHPERARFYASGEWRSMRQAHLTANPTCVRCGAPATHADHIEAIALGGRQDGALQSLCRACHATKTVRDSHEAAKRAAAKRRQP